MTILERKYFICPSVVINMVYTEVLSTIAVVLVVVVIGIQYYFMRFLSVNGEKTDIMVTEQMANMRQFIEESIGSIFDDGEELSQQEQEKQEQEQAEQFMQTVTVAMIQAFQTPEMKQTIAEIIAPIAPSSILPAEDMAKLGEMEGAAVVNMVSSINPFMPKIIENFMGPDWQSEIQKNPQMFIALLTKLQQSGALNFFQSFLGGNSVPGGNQSPPISKGNSGW